MRSGYPHFLWVVTRDHSSDTAHVYLPTSSRLPFTTKDVLITFLWGRNFTSLNVSRLFYRWSYGVLLYEIFTIGRLLDRLSVQ